MSTYKVNDYINKKISDIAKETPVIKAYNLGLAVGIFTWYKEYEREFGKEQADKDFKKEFDGIDEFNNILRTLVGLYHDDSNLKTEYMLDMLTYKKPCMSDETRDLIEEFMRFLNAREKHE